MKSLLTLAAVLSTALTGVLATSVPNEDPRMALIKERQSGRFATNGINPASPSSQVPLRTEFHTLRSNPDLWNLYILGLQQFQQMDQSQLTSFYQVAGIHGRPYTTWNGFQATGNPNTGYCTHSSILFLTWHRPYLALYEQILYNLIQQIAGQFPNNGLRARYQAAARNFRIPYWDWAIPPASGDSSFPYDIGYYTSQWVITPTSNGQYVLIDNPLFSYKFHPVSGSDFPNSPFNRWRSTIRWPSNPSDPNAFSQNYYVDQAFSNNRQSLSDGVYALFSAAHDYRSFSNTGVSTTGSAGSLEDIHNTVHGMCGGSGGDMSYLDYAAFDPLFWLHHANIDRLFAMWQVINPSSWVVPMASPGTYTNRPGSTEDQNTPLLPFTWDTSGDAWTSNYVYYTTNFGYAYPETQRWKYNSQTSYQSSVAAAINQLYGRNAPANTVKSAKARRDKHTLPLNSSSIANPLGGNDNGTYNEWSCEIKTNKHGLGTSYTVFTFIGSYSNDSKTWLLEKNLAGSYNLFTAQNIPTNDNMIVGGAIPLTTTLLDRVKSGSLASLGTDDVTKYLKTQLQWRVMSVDGTVIDNNKVPGLEVKVISNAVTPPAAADQLPSYNNDYLTHPNVTDSKSAGYGRGA